MYTIDNSKLSQTDLDPENFTYQKDLTKKLDANSESFDQSIINEIVLWKVNRYAHLSDDTLLLLNAINPLSVKMDESLTLQVLMALLDSKGVRLPMASTILRFRNPDVYQIIDQRVYRFLYGQTAKYPADKAEAAALYIRYLRDLKLKCEEYSVPFRDADRVLYLADKRLNKNIRLDNY